MSWLADHELLREMATHTGEPSKCLHETAIHTDLSYTFNNVNQLSAIADADDGDFSCTVTCDINDKTPQRRTFQSPTSEGDQRHLYGQGKPQAKNSSGAGSNWYLGDYSESSGLALVTVNSRTMFDGTVTATDMDRATDAREKGRIGIFGTGKAYAGSSGRVTSERIGRDLNPLGRGDGNAFVGGAQNYGRIAPRLPGNASPGGWGNSVNNGDCVDCGEDHPPNGDGNGNGCDEEALQVWCLCMGTVCCEGINPFGDYCCCPGECGAICGGMSGCPHNPDGGQTPEEWCGNHLDEREAECGPSPCGDDDGGGGVDDPEELCCVYEGMQDPQRPIEIMRDYCWLEDDWGIPTNLKCSFVVRMKSMPIFKWIPCDEAPGGSDDKAPAFVEITCVCAGSAGVSTVSIEVGCDDPFWDINSKVKEKYKDIYKCPCSVMGGLPSPID